MILITGDVTDYIFEKDDNRAGGGNFYLFEQLVRGSVASPTAQSEELSIPVFTILGNHDYRPNGYDLLTDLDLGDEGAWDWWPDWLYTPAKSKNINGYAAHNLTEEEALALQGGQKERLDLGRCLRNGPRRSRQPQILPRADQRQTVLHH